MVRNPENYVKEKYDDAKQLAETILAEGVTEVKTEQLNNGGPVSDGDKTERKIWVIGSGESDPSEAKAEDLIFEEES